MNGEVGRIWVRQHHIPISSGHQHAVRCVVQTFLRDLLFISQLTMLLASQNLLPRAFFASLTLLLSPPASAQAIYTNVSTAAALFWLVLPTALIAATLFNLLFRLGQPALAGKLVVFYLFCLLLFIVVCLAQPFVALWIPLLPWFFVLATILALWVAARRRAARRERDASGKPI